MPCIREIESQIQDLHTAKINPIEDLTVVSKNLCENLGAASF